MKLRSLTTVSATEAGLLIEAFVALLWAKTILSLLPFARITRRFDRPIPRPRKDDQRVAAAIGLALNRLHRHLPWRPTCLVRSIAAMVMLRRRRLPGVLSIGARRPTDEDLEAHAWVVSGGEPVVCARECASYTVLTTCGQD